ncbi:MAG: anti-sigma factor family protein [Actinomycetota bacterium]
MTCDDFQLRLTAYSLGELEQDELQAARDHVAGCDDCASRALLDRQLTALVRGSAVPAPAETRSAVLAAVRAEARRDEAGPSDASRPGRRRHWIALAAALLAAAAVIAAALLVTPAPDPGSPLAAAWSSYHARGKNGLGSPSEAQADRLSAVLGPASRTPDLAGFGLRKDGWEARDLAGHLASVAEYRDPQGGRLTVMRWRGELPAVARAPAGSGLKAYRWGRHTSYWWRADGVVWCLVGTIDQERLYAIAEHLGGESQEGAPG